MTEELRDQERMLSHPQISNGRKLSLPRGQRHKGAGVVPGAQGLSGRRCIHTGDTATIREAVEAEEKKYPAFLLLAPPQRLHECRSLLKNTDGS